MKPSSQERGQALIIIALAAVGLFAFAALAIDGSRAFSNKRHAQNAADTAVLAAALAKVRGQDYVTAALKRAESNGYTNDADSTVEVHLCNDPGVTCQGLPAGADPAEFIQVRIISSIPSTFGRVIGRQTLTSAVEAVAHVQGSSATGVAASPALVALTPTGCGICSGGVLNLHVHGSGIFSNSTDTCTPPSHGSMDMDGIGTYESDGGFINPAGAAGVCINTVTTTLIGTPQVGSQISPTYNIPAPTFACSSPEINPATDTTIDPVDGATVYPPGHYSAQLILGSTANYKLKDGNYCFDNGLQLKGGANITLSNVNIRIDGGMFDAGGGSGTGTFTCNNLLVYGAAGSGLHFSGNGQVNCTGVTFYMQSGGVTWNGNSNSNLKAPTSGPYKGLLIYLPATNTEVVKINGTSNNQLVGSIIAPGSEIYISGNSGSAGYNTQIIGNHITLAGNSNTTINYDANAQYNPPDSPTIGLTE